MMKISNLIAKKKKLEQLEELTDILCSVATIVTVIAALATDSVLIANPIMLNCVSAFFALTIMSVLLKCMKREKLAIAAGFAITLVPVIGVCCGLAQGYLAAGSLVGSLAIALISLVVAKSAYGSYLGAKSVDNKTLMESINHSKFMQLAGIVYTSLGIAALSHFLVVTQSASTATGVLLATTLALATAVAAFQTVNLVLATTECLAKKYLVKKYGIDPGLISEFFTGKSGRSSKSLDSEESTMYSSDSEYINKHSKLSSTNLRGYFEQSAVGSRLGRRN